MNVWNDLYLYTYITKKLKSDAFFQKKFIFFTFFACV